MIIILKIVFWIILLTLAFSALSLAPWVPTRKKDLTRIKKLANMKSGQVFYDLGCGDGRVADYISQDQNIRAIGIEIAVPFFFVCKLRQWRQNKKNLDFKLKNLFNTSLYSADVVYMFAASRKKLTGKIIKKLEAELKPGARIISYAFPIPGWKPVSRDQSSPKEVAIYLYIKS